MDAEYPFYQKNPFLNPVAHRFGIRQQYLDRGYLVGIKRIASVHLQNEWYEKPARDRSSKAAVLP